MSNYTISFTKQQEQYSIAYIHAVTSIAGYSLEEVKVDEDSVDATIYQRGNGVSNGEDYPLIEGLRVQLKCTYKHQPKSDGFIHFPISKKNYNDLRRERTQNPRILVVLYTPQELTGWLHENPDSMILYNTAHWLSLRGDKQLSSEQDSKTIKIAISQKFTPSELTKIMNRLARGEMPWKLKFLITSISIL